MAPTVFTAVQEWRAMSGLPMEPVPPTVRTSFADDSVAIVQGPEASDFPAYLVGRVVLTWTRSSPPGAGEHVAAVYGRSVINAPAVGASGRTSRFGGWVPIEPDVPVVIDSALVGTRAAVLGVPGWIRVEVGQRDLFPLFTNSFMLPNRGGIPPVPAEDLLLRAVFPMGFIAIERRPLSVFAVSGGWEYYASVLIDDFYTLYNDVGGAPAVGDYVEWSSYFPTAGVYNLLAITIAAVNRGVCELWVDGGLVDTKTFFNGSTLFNARAVFSVGYLGVGFHVLRFRVGAPGEGGGLYLDISRVVPMLVLPA